ncbi:hypothetical protein Plec18167_004873 [Paecilomyces lecythidis]|uniref:Uncharacterized protein n=1 Tax=Paecilomyces lecythidis TaxID=3004212 RepID=A0ABR3XN80_9EURO
MAYVSVTTLPAGSGAGFLKPQVPALISPENYTRFHLPGFTLPLDWKPYGLRTRHVYEDGKSTSSLLGAEGYGECLFPTALDPEDHDSGYASLDMITLRERTMLEIMNQITDKPDWDEKVFNEEIVGRWREEVRRGRDVTDRMMDYVIAELRHNVKEFRETRIVPVYDSGVVKSDSIVTESTRLALKEAVRPLEDVPDKDYHPGSDEKVLDLVHPSLFPLVYGRSRILKHEVIDVDNCLSHVGTGELLPVPEYVPAPRTGPWNWRRAQLEKIYSNKFQWLPCDVELTGESDCKITSYINNLHPVKHKELYPIIENVIARAIPLWNRTLTPLDRDLRYKARRRRITYEEAEYEEFPEDERPQQGEDEPDEVFWDRDNQWEYDNRRVILPEPEEFVPHECPKVDIRKLAKDRGLQVIVKLANIELSPEKPEYGGGSWHVEGQMNEHICATALYYYDSENITESRLAFRQECSDDAQDVSYAQDHHEWLETVFGCEQQGPQVQEVGDIVCRQGRLLTFPNVLQHRVSPFKLEDPTKPGHRKILALFLVDPHIRVISTANIPPQRRDWWEEEFMRQNPLQRLPAELTMEVVGRLDSPMSMEEAKELRLELMDERKAFVDEQTDMFHSHTFSLCEH